MKTDRSLLMYILLSIITCDIYALIFWGSMVDDINTASIRRTGTRSTNFWLMFFILGPISCGICTIVWAHNLSQRIGDEARARGMNTDFGAGTFWLWNVLGSMIIVGPFIYMAQMIDCMNFICADYNQKGC